MSNSRPVSRGNNNNNGNVRFVDEEEDKALHPSQQRPPTAKRTVTATSRPNSAKPEDPFRQPTVGSRVASAASTSSSATPTKGRRSASATPAPRNDNTSAVVATQKQPEKTLSDPSAEQLYNFHQPRDMFAHDVPNMRPPSSRVNVPTPLPGAPMPRVVRELKKATDSARRHSASPASTAYSGYDSPTMESQQSFVDSPRRPGTAQTQQQEDELQDALNHAAAKHRPTRTQPTHAPSDEEDRKKIKNAEDAITFFSSNKLTSTALKFVYLNRNEQRPGARFRPYDLHVVPRGYQDPQEYFVVSATGVVCMQHGQPSEVVGLSSWMRESSLFNVISRIHFFRKYLCLKAFDQWRRNVRFAVFCQTRKRMCRHFFLAKSTFAKPLMDMYKEAHALQMMPMMRYPPIRQDYASDRFAGEQAQARAEAVESFRTTIETVEMKLQRLCEEVLHRANVPNLGTMEALHQYLMASAAEDATGRKVGAKKMVSMVKAQEDMTRRMQQLKAAMDENSALPNFIRLIDSIVAEGLFQSALRALESFLLELHKEREDEKIVFFLIHVDFNDEEEGLMFVPNCTDITKMYNELCDDVIRSVSQLPRIATLRPFRIYFDNKVQRPFQLQAALLADYRYRAHRDDTTGLLSRDFKSAEASTKHYGANRRWHVYVHQEWPQTVTVWDVRIQNETQLPKTVWRVEGPDYMHSKDFQDAFVSCGTAIAKLREMHPMRRGCLNITSQQLNDSINVKLKDIQHDIRQRLQVVCRIRLEKLGAVLRELSHVLSERPTQLGKFAEFVKRVNQISADEPSLMEMASELETIFLIGEANQCDVDLSKRDLILGSVQNPAGSRRDLFEETLIGARDFIRTNRKDMGVKLDSELEALGETIHNNITMLNGSEFTTYTSDYEEILSCLKRVEEEIRLTVDRKKVYSEWQRLFEIPVNEWSHLDALISTYDQRHELWQALYDLQELRATWGTKPLAELDVKEVARTVEDMWTMANKLNRKNKNDVSERFLDFVKEEKQHLPTVLHLGNPNLKQPHWGKIFAALNQSTATMTDPTLDRLRAWKIFDHKNRDVVAEQSSIATGEAELAQTVENVKLVWQDMAFGTKPHRDNADQHILDDVADIQEKMEENILTIQGCLASRFVGPIRTEVEDWDMKLNLLSNILTRWISVQGSWIYLEFIFSSEDIKRQLPTESTKFARVDSEFKELMNNTRKIKKCIPLITEHDVLQMLTEAQIALDAVQKGLEEYLETKRSAFPRFYFLSNDELLQILSDVRNPRAVRRHLQKCFENIKDLDFSNQAGTEISAMISSEGEYVPFDEIVFAKGNVETWLLQIEVMMRVCLQTHMGITYKGYSKMERTAWLLAVAGKQLNTSSPFPAQCTQAIDCVIWTSEVEAAILAHELPQYYKTYIQTILEMVDLVRRNLTPLQRRLIGTLLVVDVHNRDVVETLVKSNIEDLREFAWNMQLRYYWQDETVHIEHANASLRYGYEYLGNVPRLVITPLTDRAFLTLTSALHLKLGGAPQGPAGTGKTESVKDLGKALARQVIVFNCSDGINYKTMSQMFAGLAQAGAWACFDEFNRIELEVLSVIAQQMLEITSALSVGTKNMNFDGRDISLHPDFGVFITMNPGYAGRTELPDNLKALFRPVCMMIPDYALIAEIMFFSEGFKNARILARKMVQLYKLSSEQLSKQDHYDFGMRAVKSILVMAGSLKRGEPDTDEDTLLIRAMRDSNLPKFLRDDAVLFNALIKDLYPGVAIQEKQNPDLDECIPTILREENLQPAEGFVLKLHQLFETMIVRHGIMMVGQTLCAKTECMRVLQLAQSRLATTAPNTHAMFQNTHQHVLNPKSITQEELYGGVNETTKEWTDGILSKIVREVVDMANHSPDRNWVVFDGPVDAVWIENMNTVLDDNKMLCLNNGERIKLSATVSFCFEVQDLRVASPATVSRCGMVYVEPQNLDGGWRPLFTSLVATQSQRNLEGYNARRLSELVELVMPSCLEFVREHCHEYVPSVDAQLVVSCVRLLECFLTKLHEKDDDITRASDPVRDGDDDDDDQDDDDDDGPGLGGRKENENAPIVIPSGYSCEPLETAEPTDLARLFDMYFVLALTWSVGGNISSRAKFAEHIRTIVRRHLPHVALPDDHSPYEVYVHKMSNTWAPWTRRVPDFLFNRAASFSELFVHTSETVANTYLLLCLSSNKHHVLQSGVTGTGKSVGCEAFMVDTLNAEDNESAWYSFKMVFSAQTGSMHVQEKVENKLKKLPSRGKHVTLGPPLRKTAIFFVDDVNLPAIEKYGACPVVEFLRQVITQGGFYERGKKEKTQGSGFKCVENMLLLAACGIPGGGRHQLTARFTSRFHLLCQPVLADATINSIFATILQGFLSNFSEDVRTLHTNIASSATALYRRISTERLPTPSRVHYTFNLRDVSKVIQGIMQITPPKCQTVTEMMRLWLHETSRVFHDRLIDTNDTAWWYAAQKDVMRTYYTGQQWPQDAEKIIFGDLFNRDEKIYENLEWGAGLSDLLQECLMGYGIKCGKEVELVLFEEAVKHLCRICRIIRQPRGNALLIGVTGSGRRSLTQLAAFICEMNVGTISITRNYGVGEFRDDIRKVLLECGCEAKPTVFMMSDTQVVKEQFLEDVNNLLNTGEIMNLWQPEDTDKIVSSVRNKVKAAGKQETLNTMMTFFTNICRDMLHIVLMMSPIGDQFRTRLRMFPSLVNCMTLDWFSKWPSSALKGVAHRLLARSVAEGSMDLVSTLCVHMHTTVEAAGKKMADELRRHTYTTPTSYINMLNGFSRLFEEQTQDVEMQLNKFQGGLTKLVETSEMVTEMEKELVRLQPELERQSKETTAFAERVEIEQKAATEVALVVSKEEKQCQAIMKDAKEIKDDCQVDLDKAMPAFEAALAALNSLRKEDINETKAYTSPPAKVMMVLDAVLTILEKPLGWDSAKKMMNDAKFLETLQKVDKDNIPDRTQRKLKKYIALEDFNATAVKSVSNACVSLVLWARALDNYCDVTRNMGPKKERLAAAEAKLEGAQKELRVKQDELRKAEENIAQLRNQFETSMAKKQQLEDEKKKTEARLNRAGKLVNGLAGEKIRWSETVQRLNKDKTAVLGSALITAAYIAYCGPFTASYRQNLVSGWLLKAHELGIIVPQSYEILKTIDPVITRDWNRKGLPADDFSVENGILLTKSLRWCLCIDPQSQANMWLKEMYRERGLRTMKPSDPSLMRTIETCVRLGVPVLIENVGEELETALDPILLKNTFTEGSKTLLRIGESVVEYDDKFALIMTTKLPNPHYMPELQVKVTILNFGVTSKGLEDQLLADVVRCERPDLEDKANGLVVQLAEGRSQLKDVENNILSMLRNAQGNILDNEDLIETLSQSKVVAERITKDVESAEATAAEIQLARDKYRPIATRGSIMFFVIADIANIQHMYQYSSAFFKKLFIQTLEKTEHPEGVDAIVVALTKAVTSATYRTVSRGLFEMDKPIFAFLMCMSILRHENIVSQAEWSFFLKGAGGVQIEDPRLAPDWLPQSTWDQVQSLAQVLDTFEGLDANVADNDDEWHAWYDQNNAFESFPDYLKTMSLWHQAIATRCFRDDSTSAVMRALIGQHLGEEFTVSPAFDLESSYADATCLTPIIFVLCPGTDPTILFRQFAELKGFTSKCYMMSLGQDQGPKAEEFVRSGSIDGWWVYLQNCHVYKSWMPSLERVVEELGKDTHKDFRLWLTSLSTTDFPSTVLQAGVKITREPPKGLKANMKDNFSAAVSEQLWLDVPSHRQTAWHRLLTCLVMAHGVVQERRRFGPLGWNILYDWNSCDLDASIKQLRNYVAEFDNVPWEAVQYFLATINYGGRVSDFLDLRCLNVILKKFISPPSLDSSTKFSDDGVYVVVTSDDLGEVNTYIDELPSVESPMIFGLHPNADITFMFREARRLIETITELQPRSGGGAAAGGLSEDEVVLKIAQDFIERVPMDIDKESASPETFRITEDGTMVSIGTVCTQEVDRFNKLLGVLRLTLKNLCRAIKGEVLMDRSLENMNNAFLLGRVPELWSAAAFPSLKPLVSWFRDLTERVSFMSEWVFNGPPQSFWLSAFFFPPGFLTAVLQTHARTRQLPIDDLQFQTQVTRETEPDGSLESLDAGVYVHGLFMEGAAWNLEKKCIEECRPRELNVAMPIIALVPISGSNPPQPSSWAEKPNGDMYDCPVYKVSTRAGTLSTTGQSTNYIMSMALPGGMLPPSHWIMRAVALLTMLDD